MHPTESSSIQEPIIRYAESIGWTRVPRETSDERRNGGIRYEEFLRAKLYEFNPWLPSEYAVPNFSADISGNRDFLAFLRGRTTAYDPKENREKNVIVIDFSNPKGNVYEVTDEFAFHNGQFWNREDIVFLINGIPVTVVECKNMTKSEGLALGIDQLRRYHRETPELMVSQQAFAAAEGIGLMYGVTWNLIRRNIFTWKGDRVWELENKIKTFFDIPNILGLIEKYIMFTENDGEISKLILREHQAWAVEAVVKRCLTEKTKKRGLVWHTQGSGKTFTMIKTAELLFTSPEAEKPTILLMLDRNELEDQMVKNLARAGLGNVRKAESIDDLTDILKSDFRGIVVSMIHKFQRTPANLNTRSNIFVLIDEAHRTTAGDLGTYLMAALPNATFIGFTGTPIDKTVFGGGTFKTFGVDDEKGYLHKYSISESIEDGTTLPLYYALAPNEMLVPKETLEAEFLNLAKDHGVSDIEELNKILEKAVNTRNFLKGKGRIEKVAEFVAKHFQEHIEPMGYKAFLVGVDREACALYKKALDKHLPKEWSEVVYTGNNNDSELLKAHHRDEDDEKTLRREFAKYGTLPKILIVTEKLLTGYDAPILYAMYLDKPVRDHTLLQTIARVNRPYENESAKMVKPHGFIYDFVGIFENLEKALSFDSDEVNAVVKDIELLKRRFARKIDEESAEYLDLVRSGFSDKTIAVLIERFRDEEDRKRFFKWYTEVEMLYEIISPDAFLRPYIERYTTLSNIYTVVRSAFAKRVYVDKEFQQKTADLVQSHVTSGAVRLTDEIFEMNGTTIELIKAKNTPDEVKVINLIKSIEREAENRSGDPVLISLRDRAEDIRERFEDRQITTKEALETLLDLWDLETKRRETQKRDGISDVAWFIRDILERNSIPDPDLVGTIESIIVSNPEFASSDKIYREVRIKVYASLMDHFEDDLDSVKRIAEIILNTLYRMGTWKK